MESKINLNMLCPMLLIATICDYCMWFSEVISLSHR